MLLGWDMFFYFSWNGEYVQSYYSFRQNAFSDTSMHYNSFWEKKSFLSRALKQKAIHGQECYQTLNSGCNRHLMADVALPNHFCFSKEIKNIKDYKYKSNYKCKTKNLTTLRKLSSKNLTYNCCYSRDYGISQA